MKTIQTYLFKNSIIKMTKTQNKMTKILTKMKMENTD